MTIPNSDDKTACHIVTSYGVSGQHSFNLKTCELETIKDYTKVKLCEMEIDIQNFTEEVIEKRIQSYKENRDIEKIKQIEKEQLCFLAIDKEDERVVGL